MLSDRESGDMEEVYGDEDNVVDYIDPFVVGNNINKLCDHRGKK